MPIIKLLRIEQWAKNFFVFLPLFFDRRLTDIDCLLSSFLAFLAFCLAASGIYCLNDIYDRESDKRHPLKRMRPIASRKVTLGKAYLVMSICFIVSILLAQSVSFVGLGSDSHVSLTAVIVAYIAINVAYCIRLKRIAIVDVFTIAAGYVLRVLAGGVAGGIYISHWLILMTFLLALFLAFAKRRDDVLIYEESGKMMRDNVNRYNQTFVNQIISVVASITMICYVMYTVSPDVVERYESNYVYLTSIFVLAGIIRYLQLTIVDAESGSPTRVLLSDRFIQGCIVGWIALFAVIIYF